MRVIHEMLPGEMRQSVLLNDYDLYRPIVMTLVLQLNCVGECAL